VIPEPPRRIFVENPAGSHTKIHHDEDRLVPEFEERVSAPYPYAYGFVVGVPSGDGDSLDCFVVSERPLATGEMVDCHPVALLEQYQNSMVDHDVIAVPVDEAELIADLDLGNIVNVLTEFIGKVFDHDPSRVLEVGELWDASAATTLIEDSIRSAGDDPVT